MLVSSIARFNAINTANNAAYASMQASNSMMDLISNAHTFGSEYGLDMLHEMDNRLSMTIATNSLLYKLAMLQEKLFAKLQSDSIERNKIDYKA